MNRRITWILLAFFFISLPTQAAQKKPSPLDIVLTTTDRDIQRKALHTIAENKDDYQLEVKERIELIAQSKERSPELFILLHIAALIKCETALPILERLWLRPKTGDDVCYSCDPRPLVMTVFAVHQIWSPPPLPPEQRQNTCVHYYWWALNACEDASGECYCDACEMILRAEDYSSKK